MLSDSEGREDSEIVKVLAAELLAATSSAAAMEQSKLPELAEVHAVLDRPCRSWISA